MHGASVLSESERRESLPQAAGDVKATFWFYERG